MSPPCSGTPPPLRHWRAPYGCPSMNRFKNSPIPLPETASGVGMSSGGRRGWPAGRSWVRERGIAGPEASGAVSNCRHGAGHSVGPPRSDSSRRVGRSAGQVWCADISAVLPVLLVGHRSALEHSPRIERVAQVHRKTAPVEAELVCYFDMLTDRAARLADRPDRGSCVPGAEVHHDRDRRDQAQRGRQLDRGGAFPSSVRSASESCATIWNSSGQAPNTPARCVARPRTVR